VLVELMMKGYVEARKVRYKVCLSFNGSVRVTGGVTVGIDQSDCEGGHVGMLLILGGPQKGPSKSTKCRSNRRQQKDLF
jgi:hypothetical protein